MDTAREAREKCPELVLVHVATFMGNNPPAYHKAPAANTHKVSLDEYRRASRRIMDVFKRLCPTMNKASIDEAYLDASEQLRQQILDDFERGTLELAAGPDTMHPDALLLHSPMPYDRDMTLPAAVVRWVVVSRKGKEKETARVDGPASTEYGVLVGDPPPVTFGWGDLMLRYAARFAQHVRSTLFEELGYRASAGIAHNRFLAKIGSGLHKPDQQTILLSSQAEKFLSTYPITSIPSLGGKLGALVENAFGARTAGDLADYTVDQLALKLGAEQAQFLYNRCHGIDDSPVADNKEPATLTSAKNFLRYPVESLGKLDRWISMNSVDLWTRVVEEWELRKRWPRSLTLSYTTRGHNMRSRTTAFPPRLIKGAKNSPDAVVAAVHACLAERAGGEMGAAAARGRMAVLPATQTSDMFPMIGFSLTAKSFQRELASASMMERWLVRGSGADADGTRNAGQRPKQQIKVQDDLAEHMGIGLSTVHIQAPPADEVPGRVDSIGSSSSQGFEDEPVPALPPQRLSSMLQLASQPTTQVQPSRRHGPLQPLLPAASPHLTQAMLPGAECAPAAQSPCMHSQASTPTSTSSALTPPMLGSCAHFSGPEGGGSNVALGSAGDGLRTQPYRQSASPPPLLPNSAATQPDLVAGSEYDSSDSDGSLLRTPPESASEAGDEDDGSDLDPEAVEDAGGDAAGSGDADDGQQYASEAASILRSRGRVLGPGRPSTSTGNDGEGDRTQSRAGPSRPRNSVYIQSLADLESAARYGEGYKNVIIDRHDDGSLEVAGSTAARGSSSAGGGEGFVPALIAATRRKREIQIVRFQNPVDMPEGAISNGRVSSGKAKKPRGSRGAAGAAAKADGGDDGQDESGGYDSTSTDDEISSVLNTAVSAMMQSISASQGVMQIHCPECPETAPPIASRDWETHRDWHIAKVLQERELRHENAARHMQGAGSGTEKPASKRAKRDGSPPKRRQQTITEAWK
ncbi:N-acetyltransferase eso1 [Coemansia sp. RSA 2705]|nr:N-acetyltransferase eso1 [Coemansia sp. RSA 2705]